MKAFIYWNSHKRLFSIRVKGKVIAHARRVIVSPAEFKVSEKGRARVLANGVKNIHAGVSGEIIACEPVKASPALVWLDVANEIIADLFTDWQRVRYDPYEAGEFRIVGRGDPIEKARLVYGHANRLSGRADLYAKD